MPTVQTPTSPDVADDEYGSRRFIDLRAEPLAGGQERVDVLGALVALREHDEALALARACRAGASRSQRSVNIDWLNDDDPIESFLGSGRYSV